MYRENHNNTFNILLYISRKSSLVKVMNTFVSNKMFFPTEIYQFFWLKELQNFILCIIPVWSLFCSVQAYISLYFLPFLFRSSHQRCSIKIGILKNFAKFA